MAAAAVLSPSSSSGLSTPAEPTFTSMSKQITPTLLEPKTYLTQKMVSVLHTLGYDIASINTLITRADSNTIEASDIPTDQFLGDAESINGFLDSTLLNPATLRKQNIYLNSNEPVLVLGYPASLNLDVQVITEAKEKILTVLREKGIKPVRVYLKETGSDSDGLSFSLLNVVNSDIGVNMVSLLDSAFGGDVWKEDLVSKEAWNGFDLISRDEVWSKDEVKAEEAEEVFEEVEKVEDAPAEIVEALEDESDEVVAGTDADADAKVTAETVPIENKIVKHDTMESETAGTELRRMPDAPVRTISYKSVDDVPESDEDEEAESVQHPALRELLEREAQLAPVQHPTWSRDHDGEAYLDIIKTHSRGQEDPEAISVIARPEAEKDDFEVVDKP